MSNNEGYFGGNPAMGGNAGDGISYRNANDSNSSQQYNQNHNMNFNPPPNPNPSYLPPSTPGYSGYAQNTPANTPAGFATPQQDPSRGMQFSQQPAQQPSIYTPPAGTGSVTRFAPPSPAPPQQPQQQPYNTYGGSPQPELQQPGTFAAMSARLHQQQPKQESMYQQPQSPMGAFSQQQQQYQQHSMQQQQQPQMQQSQYSQQQQQQPQMQQPQYSQQQQQPPPMSSSQYSQQSQQYNQNQQPHQFYQNQQPQQYAQNQQVQQYAQNQQVQQYNQNLQQSQMGQSTSSIASSNAGGSFAVRSAAMNQAQQPAMATSEQQTAMAQPGAFVAASPHQQNQMDPLADSPAVIAQQNRILTEATRKVQEHAYYMKQAMERNDLPTVLERASQMVGELGEHAHAHHNSPHHHHEPGSNATMTLSPKNYYELHLRALEDLPPLEEYILQVASLGQQHQQQSNMPPMINTMGMGGPTNQMAFAQQQQQQQLGVTYTMKELYDCVHYCPNVLARLYLQVCAASALIRSGQVGAKWVLKDMIQVVKCVQNPVRGLFLRHYLLQAFRDKLPDEPVPEQSSTAQAGENNSGAMPQTTLAEATQNPSVEKGTVQDSYEFILENFMEMNKLWVRIQHLPGDGKSKQVRRRRERERNELRILVGTNLVRLSQLECVTSQIYGQILLPKVLEHIVVCNDPLAQAYLMDCIVQVFPDEYHIETLSILLGVCPKLRDKVNIRTILQSLMDRLANYLADEELLDETDTNEVKKSLAKDSFRMFDECVQQVFNARGPKLNSKEVIRLQTALLSFTMKCYQGNREQVNRCLAACVTALHQACGNLYQSQSQHQHPQSIPQLDEVSVKELETLLKIPLDELALGVLKLDHYAELIGFLPWNNRRQVALTLLNAVTNAGSTPSSVKEIEELFAVITPVLGKEPQPQQIVPSQQPQQQQNWQQQQQNWQQQPQQQQQNWQQQPQQQQQNWQQQPQQQQQNWQQQPQQQQQNWQQQPQQQQAYNQQLHMQSTERTTALMAGLGISSSGANGNPQQVMPYGQTFGEDPTAMSPQAIAQRRCEIALVSKLIHLLNHSDTDVLYEMLVVARKHLSSALATAPQDSQRNSERNMMGPALVALVYASLALIKRIIEENQSATMVEEKTMPVETEKAKQTQNNGNNDDPKADAEGDCKDKADAEGDDKEKADGEGKGSIEGSVQDVGDGEKKVEEASEASEKDVSPGASETPVQKSTSCRKVFVFVQQTIAMISISNPEICIKLYLDAALSADRFASRTKEAERDDGESFAQISNDLISQSFALYEEQSGGSKLQSRCMVTIIGTLLACRSLSKEDYERLIMKAAQYSAKMLRKSDQCEMVGLCSHLFYVVEDDCTVVYSNTQRGLECLQRALKLADACATIDPSDLKLFVNLLDHYLFFFEKKNPSITGAYISGLLALIKEHSDNAGQYGGAPSSALLEAKSHFQETVRYIKRKKEKPENSEQFAEIDIVNIPV